MSKLGASLTNYSSQSIRDDKRRHQPSSSSQPIFILCDNCYLYATYLDKTRIPSENVCPQCGANNNNSELTSFPVVSNVLFTFDHNDKCELDYI
jgi:hypothetical protein